MYKGVHQIRKQKNNKNKYYAELQRKPLHIVKLVSLCYLQERNAFEIITKKIVNFSLPKITQYANLLQPTVLHRRNDSICWKKGISRKDEYLRGENVLCMLAYSKWLNVQDVRRITTLIASQIGPNKKGKFCSFALSKRRSAVLLHMHIDIALHLLYAFLVC